MSDEETKAKIFISCGQRHNSDEVEIAHRIGERLSRLGYEPYIAGEEQTLLGVKENILRQLETSEYFIFIDFKRERIVTNHEQVWRGSLFSHQELAVASYLDIPLIAFQEIGVRRQDGFMRFLQSNATPFSDRQLLPNIIADRVQELEWKPDWKNGLSLERDETQFVNAMRMPENRMARYFHIAVRNLHERKFARNCYAYLEKIVRLPDTEIPVETIEFKWAGYLLPNAVIGPRQARRFDALWLCHDERPSRVRFNVIADSTEFVPRVREAGDYHLTYAVVSDSFPTARATFALHVGLVFEETQLRIVSSVESNSMVA